MKVKESKSHSVTSEEPARLLSLWNSSGQNTGVGSHSLLQGICPTQGLNPGLPRRRWILYCLSHQASLCQKTATYSVRPNPKDYLFQNDPDHTWRFPSTFFWGIIHEDNTSGNYLITRQPSSFNQILQTHSILCLHILFPQTDITNQP